MNPLAFDPLGDVGLDFPAEGIAAITVRLLDSSRSLCSLLYLLKYG